MSKDSQPASNEPAKIAPMTIKGRIGGIYIPPHKLAQMQREASDKSSPEYQRQSWEALKKSLNGIINKVNVTNITNIIPEMFQENLIRGRGLFCRALMKAQLTSPGFTHVYAALVAIVNTKLPEIGELLIKRIVFQFRRCFKRNDKIVSVSLARFVSHLVNQRVASELLVLQLLVLLLEKPTNDSVEIAVNVTKECGLFLTENCPEGLNRIFESFRRILHEGLIDKRTQYVIEQLFAVRRTNYSEYPSVAPELDLIEEGDQVTHNIGLNDTVDKQEYLDVFTVDKSFVENEMQWDKIRKEILGESSDSEGESEHDGNDDDEDDDDVDDVDDEDEDGKEEGNVEIEDSSEQDLLNLNKTIYLIRVSSASFEECAHKLLKLTLKPGQEISLCRMVVEMSTHEAFYNDFYGYLSQRLCNIDRKWSTAFTDLFAEYFEKCEGMKTESIRTVATLFAYLLCVEAISWEVMGIIVLTEDDTTSSTRIFIKVLLLEIVRRFGLAGTKTKFSHSEIRPYLQGLFPSDNAPNIRFAINYYTSINLGGLTEELRERLQNMKQNKG